MSAAPISTHVARLARRRHRLLALVPVEVLVLALLSRSHRGVHVVQNLVLPGSGLYENHAVLGAALTIAAVAAVCAWSGWGADWTVAAVWLGAIALTAWLAPRGHAAVTAAPRAAAHEFPIVALLVGALTWLRATVRGLPGVQRWRARRTARGVAVDPVTAGHAAAIAALGPAMPSVVLDPRAMRRARRIALVARGRRRDALRLDHAGLRAALALTGQLDADGRAALLADAARRATGVPASEPSWVRPLDATLAAIALHRLGATDEVARWQATLAGPLGLRRGHRPAWCWTPIGLGAGRAPLWEHAAMSALNRDMGWIDDADWAALRTRLVGASARGSRHPFDERAIAAARLWLAHVDDPEAARIIDRPTVAHDPVAVALDRLAAAHRSSAAGVI